MSTTDRAARLQLVVGTLLLVTLVLAGCSQDNEKTTKQPIPTPTVTDATPVHATTSTQPSAKTIAGVTFTPAPSWTDLGPAGMRRAQFREAPISGDTAPAEVNVFYFGPQSGGGIEANLQRWIGQMILPDGTDPQQAAQRDKFTTDGMAGHIISLNGSYKSGGGRPMGGGGQIMENYRLVGVVIEGPLGSLFFKLTGPLASAQAMEGELLTMVKAAHK